MKQSSQCCELQNRDISSYVFATQELILDVLCLHFENVLNVSDIQFFSNYPQIQKVNCYIKANGLLLPPQPCQSPPPPSL